MCVCISKGTVHVCCLYWSVCVCVFVWHTFCLCMQSGKSGMCGEPCDGLRVCVCVCVCVFLSPCRECVCERVEWGTVCGLWFVCVVVLVSCCRPAVSGCVRERSEVLCVCVCVCVWVTLCVCYV